MESESGWERVSRRRSPSRNGEYWASRIKAAAARGGGSSPLKEDTIGGKAVSFYTTNFLEIWKEDEIWKALQVAGQIVDLFIAKKETRLGECLVSRGSSE